MQKPEQVGISDESAQRHGDCGDSEFSHDIDTSGLTLLCPRALDRNVTCVAIGKGGTLPASGSSACCATAWSFLKKLREIVRVRWYCPGSIPHHYFTPLRQGSWPTDLACWHSGIWTSRESAGQWTPSRLCSTPSRPRRHAGREAGNSGSKRFQSSASTSLWVDQPSVHDGKSNKNKMQRACHPKANVQGVQKPIVSSAGAIPSYLAVTDRDSCLLRQ